jgi:hypothetical protein
MQQQYVISREFYSLFNIFYVDSGKAKRMALRLMCNCKGAAENAGKKFDRVSLTMYQTESKDGETCRFCKHFTFRDYTEKDRKTRSDIGVPKEPERQYGRKRRSTVGNWHKVD